MSVPMQRYITVSFNVKIGKPQGNSRTYAEPATTFTFDTTEDSFGGLRFKVTERLAQVTARYNESHATTKDKSVLQYDESFLILVKPAVSTKQANFVVIDESNFMSTVAVAWANHHMKQSQGGNFVLDVFVYVDKVDRNAKQIRRATPDRRAEMARQILAVDRERQPGPSALTYISTSYARQIATPDFVNLPNNASIRQLNHIDNEMETNEQERESRARESEQLYREIRFMINGDSVKMVVNIADLRSALGLPQFDLYAPFRAPVPFQDPVNMQDEDHADESNET
ncbi:hypothetical protein AC1031_018948 [Aphanomyces cochlioides]|nr:hypothetical protein AC1031_018948 [Aphanomyces cochlioides]